MPKSILNRALELWRKSGKKQRIAAAVVVLALFVLSGRNEDKGGEEQAAGSGKLAVAAVPVEGQPAAPAQQPKRNDQKAITNSLGMKFVRIPAGTFKMGIDDGDRLSIIKYKESHPVHDVTISRDFWLGQHEVTQAQWEEVMGNNPSKFKGPDRPVETVGWRDVREFIKRLNEKEGHQRYRLPTEAEWEYAARAGTTGFWFFPSVFKLPGQLFGHSPLANETFGWMESEDKRTNNERYDRDPSLRGMLLHNYAWHRDNSLLAKFYRDSWVPQPEETMPVGLLRPNPWGLYDIYGNVWEMVQDWYDGVYSAEPAVDPQGPEEGEMHVMRGGSFGAPDVDCSSFYRSAFSDYHLHANWTTGKVGFRLAMDTDEVAAEKKAAAEEAAKRAAAEKKVREAAIAKIPTHTNSIGMKFKRIPAGKFMMGCDEAKESCSSDEKPRHEVTISRDFWLGQFEVTQAQWEKVMGNNPSEFKGPDRPVEKVSWNDAQEFIKKLNEKEGHDRYRLPTEAEWEYAARAGTATRRFFGDGAKALVDYAWYYDNADDQTHPVGQKEPNPWGLYDIYGNVWEWVQDWLGDYRAAPAVDPQGPGAGERRLLRGGSWSNPVSRLRSAHRVSGKPAGSDNLTGFRVAMVPEDVVAQKAAEKEARAREIAKTPPHTDSIGLGMKFMRIPAGKFMMGSDKGAKSERPKHQVEITKPFYLAKTEVTQAQWEAVMGNNPSRFKGPDLPVEQVSWNDVQAFIKKLNEKEGHDRYRLPTEAEWEYAARADSDTEYFFGDDPAQLDNYAWYKDNAQGTTHPVAQKEPNAWGLYDMIGNVWEWTADRHGEGYYGKSPVQDPKGPTAGDSRLRRGPGWNNEAKDLRSATRGWRKQREQLNDLGFRLAMTAE